MNILVLNGSPKGEKSNTYRLTSAFLAGMGEECETVETREMAVNRLNIRPCLGCFSCWNKTPGKCCIADDMAEVIENMLWADVTIWSFPLYYFSVPGPLKNLMDRQLPMVLPFMTEDGGETGSGSHPARYDMSGKRTVLISTCGFYTAEGNYDGVRSLFDHICGKNRYTALFCGQGELFRVPELKQRTEEYLGYVRQAGREYIRDGISAETAACLKQLLFPRKVFEEMADASWGVTESGEKADSALTFTKQMAALYNPSFYPGSDIILDMDYTDIRKRYRIILGKAGSRVTEDFTEKPTTVIHTPLSVWQSIAAGEMKGSDALMRHLYSVEGNFELMLKWDDFFGADQTAAVPEKAKAPEGKTNMRCMLLPWIIFWIAPSVHSFYGTLFSLAACVLLPLLLFRDKKTVYDIISGAVVGMLSIVLLLDAPMTIVIPLSYLAFGVMWGVTVFLKIPITAEYSMNDYGGESALGNPMFLRTNRILTAAWSVLYLLTAIMTCFIIQTRLGTYIGAINSVLPLLMGAFTAWFQKWYPAKIARG